MRRGPCPYLSKPAKGVVDGYVRQQRAAFVLHVVTKQVGVCG